MQELEADPAAGIHILLAQLDRAREAHDALVEQRAELELEMSAQGQLLAGKTVEVQKLEQQLAEITAFHGELNEQLAALRERLPNGDPLAQLDQLLAGNAELSGNQGELTAQLEALRERLPDGDPLAQVDRLLSDNAELSGNQGELTAQLEALRERLPDGDPLAELDLLLAGKTELNEELARYREQVAELEREVTESADAAEAAAAKAAAAPPVAAVEPTIPLSALSNGAHTERALQAKLADLAETRTALACREAELHDTRQDLDQSQRRNDGLRRELDETQRELDHLQVPPIHPPVVRDRSEQILRLEQEVASGRGRELELEEQLRGARAVALSSPPSLDLAERERLAAEGLRVELDRLQMRNQTLQSDRDGLRAELEESARRMDQVQAGRAKLLEELGESRLECDQSAGERRQLERQVSQYDSQLKKLEAQTAEVTGLLAMVQEQLGAEKLRGGTLSELASELCEVVDHRVNQLQEELVAEQSGRQQVQEESDQAQGQVVELESALREVGGERERLERRLEERDRDFELRNVQLVATHQQEQAKLTLDFDELSHRYQEVCDNFKNFHDTRRNEREKLQLDLNHKLVEMEVVNRRVSELENEMVTQEVIRGEKLRQREEQVSELRILLEEARVELGERRTERQGLLRAQEEAQAQLELVRQEVADHLVDLEAHRDRAEREVTKLRERLTEVEEQGATETASLHTELAASESRVQELDKTLSADRSKINELEQRVRTKLDEAGRRERSLEQSITQAEHDLQVLNTAYTQRGERIEGLESELDEVLLENEQLTAVSTAPALVNGQQLASQITDIHKALGEFASREKSERTQLEQALGAIGSQVKKLAERDSEESRPRRRRTGRTYPAVTPESEMREDVAREEKASRVDKAAENDLEATLERLRSLHSGE